MERSAAYIGLWIELAHAQVHVQISELDDRQCSLRGAYGGTSKQNWAQDP